MKAYLFRSPGGKGCEDGCLGCG